MWRTLSFRSQTRKTFWCKAPLTKTFKLWPRPWKPNPTYTQHSWSISHSQLTQMACKAHTNTHAHTNTPLTEVPTVAEAGTYFPGQSAQSRRHSCHSCEIPVVQTLTIIAVSDAVLQHGVPLLLFLLRHHTEVVVAGVRVPEDERKWRGTLYEWIAAQFGLNAYNELHAWLKWWKV